MAATSRPRPLVGLAAGLVAGLAASAAMAAFQSWASGLVPDSDDDPATVKAADAAMRAATGDAVPHPYRAPAGQAVHYVVGTLLGGAYGLVAEYWPDATSGFGNAYGLVTSIVIDEGAVPVAGLGPSLARTPIATHLYGAASHLVFGTALESVRTLLAGQR